MVYIELLLSHVHYVKYAAIQLSKRMCNRKGGSGCPIVIQRKHDALDGKLSSALLGLNRAIPIGQCCGHKAPLLLK
jgi:hypothetical protein